MMYKIVEENEMFQSYNKSYFKIIRKIYIMLRHKTSSTSSGLKTQNLKNKVTKITKN